MIIRRSLLHKKLDYQNFHGTNFNETLPSRSLWPRRACRCHIRWRSSSYWCSLSLWYKSSAEERNIKALSPDDLRNLSSSHRRSNTKLCVGPHKISRRVFLMFAPSWANCPSCTLYFNNTDGSDEDFFGVFLFWRANKVTAKQVFTAKESRNKSVSGGFCDDAAAMEATQPSE